MFAVMSDSYSVVTFECDSLPVMLTKYCINTPDRPLIRGISRVYLWYVSFAGNVVLRFDDIAHSIIVCIYVYRYRCECVLNFIHENATTLVVAKTCHVNLTPCGKISARQSRKVGAKQRFVDEISH